MDMINKFFERLRELFTEIVYGWKTFREKNRFVDWFVGWFDWIAILSGVFALLFIFLGLIEKEQSWVDNWVFVNGAICVLYLLYSTWLMLFNRVKFDWHLLNGNFLRKVICLVVLVPFLITSVLVLCDYKGWQRDLIYQDGMYHQDSPDCNGVHENQKDPSLLWTVYYHFIDPGNQHAASTDQGRNWAALIAILGVFLLNGLLVSSIVSWIDKRKDRWEKGMEPYKSFLKRRKHYVIIGGHDMVLGIVEQIFEKEKDNELKSWKEKLFPPYILIQTSRDVEQYRHELFSNFNTEEQKRIIIIYGNRNVEEDVELLQLNKATELYIIGEESRTDDMESYHDTMNMKCLDLVFKKVGKISHFKKIEKENGKESIDNRLLCRFMFEYQTTFNVFQYSEISDTIKECINFKPFHYYEMWAQNVLINNPLQRELKDASGNLKYDYLPLEGEDGIKKDSKDYVHLVVVGMTRMGTALATQAALMAHYPNFVTKGIRTKITLIDENADKEKNFFIDRYDRLFALSNWSYKEMVRGNDGNDKLETMYTYNPLGFYYLGEDFLDVEWEFIQGTVAQLKLQKYIEDCALKTNKMTIAICKDEPSRCLAAALNLEWRIYDKALQVLVYNRYDDALIKQINPSGETKFISPFGNKLKAFGMAKHCYNSKLLEEIEKEAKEIDKTYDKISKRLKREKRGLKRVTAESNKGTEGLKRSWGKRTKSETKTKSPISKSWSSIYSANTLWTKLRCVDRQNNEIKPEGIDILAKIEHNRWNIEQLIMSYRHLTIVEQEEARRDSDKKGECKREMAHLDICSNERLKIIDKEAIRYDVGFAKYLSKKKNDGSRDNSTAC